jgi:hypothetical protein
MDRYSRALYGWRRRLARSQRRVDAVTILTIVVLPVLVDLTHDDCPFRLHATKLASLISAASYLDQIEYGHQLKSYILQFEEYWAYERG